MDDAAARNVHTTFGAPAAERDIDHGLIEYFVDTQAYERVRSGSKVIVVGSRGSGKSAIFQMLARQERARGTSVVELSPERGSWAKSSAYAVAWKYLLLVQVMQQLALTIGNRGANRPIVRFLRDNLVGHQGSPIASLISYLKRIESVKIGTYEAGIKVRELDRLYKLDELRPMIPAIQAVCEHHKVIVLVDELDRGWDASDDARAFVAGLFQAAASTNTLSPNLRVYISLRQELYDTIPSLYEDAQKYRDLMEVLKWDEDLLMRLIANRIRYSLLPDVDLPDKQCWSKVFVKRLDTKRQRSFYYVVDRTLYRPREIIQFCTQALESAGTDNGSPPIGLDAILQAEELYSEDRTKDIAAEYRYQYPDLLSVFEAFRGGGSAYDRDELEHVCLEIALGERRVSESAGWVVGQEPEALIHILWRVGFLLAKVPGAAPRSERGTAYAGYHHVSTLSLRNATSFEVHPMFRSYLDVA
jgi:energy-coupling factor transporter ATP-binding protein EcfA2